MRREGSYCLSTQRGNSKDPQCQELHCDVFLSLHTGEVRVSPVVYDTVRLPCWFPFIQGVDDLRAVWVKAGKDGNDLQVYKFVNGQHDLSNQDSQFRGRADLSGDISQGKLDLTLTAVTMIDDGVYYCRAANQINHGDNSVILSVRALPPQMMESLVDGDVALVPKYFGVPTEITWKLDGSKIVEWELVSPVPHFYRLADRAALSRNGTLTIRKLRKEDLGIYKSEVLVNNYIQETELWLSVLDRVSKPTIYDSSSSQEINLSCISSTINVTYTWLDQTRGETVSTNQQDYIAPRPKENVVLTCTVNNYLSEDSESITIPYNADPDELDGCRASLECVFGALGSTLWWFPDLRVYHCEGTSSCYGSSVASDAAIHLGWSLLSIYNDLVTAGLAKLSRSSMFMST
ncbi:PREDICTED: uncharacterized protein LOC108802036 [Nanorana parkeri]|uniref:uncharacterized protein LOC108802036 n=1 Tax=Nanorana parkeri TaxID=125878 RepID=UPI0008550B6A|nr:PREDICTED: uncharacterized protein LOC108802036 [Nanorana parkeri]